MYMFYRHLSSLILIVILILILILIRGPFQPFSFLPALPYSEAVRAPFSFSYSFFEAVRAPIIIGEERKCGGSEKRVSPFRF